MSLRNRKFKAAKPKRSAKAKAPSKAFTKVVQKIINKNAETKQAWISSGNSLIMFNQNIDSAGDMQQLVPNIDKGTMPHQRIGDQVIAQSLNVRGYLKLNVNDTTDSTKLPNVIARVMIVSLKTRPGYYDASGAFAQLAALLKKGGTTSSFTGVLSDIFAPINTDLFTVHHDKRFYMNQSYINVIGASAPSTTIVQDLKNTVKFFNFNIKCKNKVLKYDSAIGSGIYPTNFGPFMLVGYANLDGSTDSILTTPVGLQYVTTLNYQDM